MPKGVRTEPGVVVGSKRCTNCGKIKPTAYFYRHKTTRDGLGSWCKVCVRVNSGERSRTPEGKAKAHAYAVSERRKLSSLAWRNRNRESERKRQADYRSSPRGKTVRYRRDMRKRLKRATDPAMIAALKSRINQCTNDLARMSRREPA